MSSKEQDFKRSQQFVVDAIKLGAHINLPSNYRNTIGIYAGSDAVFTDVARSFVLGQDKLTPELKKAKEEEREPDIDSKSLTLTSPVHARQTYIRALRKLWENCDEDIKKTIDPEELYVRKPTPIISMKRQYGARMAEQAIITALDEKKPFREVEKELGHVATHSRRTLRRLGYEVPFSDYENSKKIEKILLNETKTKVLQTTVNRDVTESFYRLHAVGENPIFGSLRNILSDTLPYSIKLNPLFLTLAALHLRKHGIVTAEKGRSGKRNATSFGYLKKQEEAALEYITSHVGEFEAIAVYTNGIRNNWVSNRMSTRRNTK